MEDSQLWTAPAEPATVRRLRHAAVEFACARGVTGTRLDDLRTCVSEAVTNCVVHAFRDGRAPGTIRVQAEARTERIVIRVSDNGVGFAPRTDSPGIGLGIPTIAALAASMSVSVAAAGGTELCMEFARA